MEPLKRQRNLIYACLCHKGEMAKPVPTKAFLQPAKAVAMCMAARGESTHLPLSHLFLLAQNLSSKQIVPTDNMRPKLHDEYTRHQWLELKLQIGFMIAFLMNRWFSSQALQWPPWSKSGVELVNLFSLKLCLPVGSTAKPPAKKEKVSWDCGRCPVSTETTIRPWS